MPAARPAPHHAARIVRGRPGRRPARPVRGDTTLKLARLLNQPAHMLLLAAAVKLFGSTRAREKMGLLQPRPSYAYGMFRAADIARWTGKKRTTVIEFGVATGNGLRAMVDLAGLIERETGVSFRVVGFDAGGGLPRVEGFKDHPELWTPGDFGMINRDELSRALAGRAELILGDIAETLPAFLGTMTADAPLGFISIDVDLYTSTVPALACLEIAPDLCNPAVSVYLDDVSMFFANRWCGELAAVEEFNAAHELRKIDIDRSLPGSRPYKHLNWYDRMYAAHILDHPLRRQPHRADSLSIDEDARRMLAEYLF